MAYDALFLAGHYFHTPTLPLCRHYATLILMLRRFRQMLTPPADADLRCLLLIADHFTPLRQPRYLIGALPPLLSHYAIMIR